MTSRSLPSPPSEGNGGPSRRAFLQQCTRYGTALTLGRFVTGCGAAGVASRPRRGLLPARGSEIDLHLAKTRLVVAGTETWATTINGGIPGPEIRLREGQDVLLRVHNHMDESSSIHWHGLLLPADMDGVPGLSFDGIPAGTTFEYRFPVRQNGTYWYHSHTGFQEQTGIYGPLVIEAAEPESQAYDREYTVVLSDWTFENPHRILNNLKTYGGYYNYQRRTLANLGDESRRMGFGTAVRDRLSWMRMRMDSTDIADVTGVTYTYLMNGLSPDEAWRGIFSPGERVRLRFINASAATYFDVRIPGLPMSVIQTDGMNVVPVETDEFRLAIAETVDVIVEPRDAAYTVFAETMDRSGYARGVLAANEHAMAAVPARRPRGLLTMDDMGMDMADMEGMEGMDHSSMPGMGGSGAMEPTTAAADCAPQTAIVARHDGDGHGAGNTMVAAVAKSRVTDPGVGLRDASWRVLTYSQLRRAPELRQLPPPAPPAREIVLHLTGNMERYMWSFDGEQFRHDTPPIVLQRGERVRFVLINDTMMAHPIHLHGVFFELEVGGCGDNPWKHTVNVKPAERVSFVVTPDEVGRWAFHCHILYHMEAGMFRVVEVQQ